MTRLPQWVKLPSTWIEDGDLAGFRWNRGKGSDNTAALMVLSVLAHHMNPEDGVTKLTYDELCAKAFLSRAKVSAGLKILESRKLMERDADSRSTFKIADYNPQDGWAKFPARGLYRNDVVSAFAHFHLRHPAELDALKLFFLFVSRRDRSTNTANISYEGIEEMTGIHTQYIKRGLTILGANGLVHIERMPSTINEYGVANAYRIAHINSRHHQGTTGRNSL